MMLKQNKNRNEMPGDDRSDGRRTSIITASYKRAQKGFFMTSRFAAVETNVRKHRQEVRHRLCFHACNATVRSKAKSR